MGLNVVSLILLLPKSNITLNVQPTLVVLINTIQYLHENKRYLSVKLTSSVFYMTFYSCIIGITREGGGEEEKIIQTIFWIRYENSVLSNYQHVHWYNNII